MKRIDRWLSMAMALILLGSWTLIAPVGVEAKTIIDIESGETAEELLSEELPAWAAAPSVIPVDAAALEVGGKSAVLMDAGTGQVLFEKNPHEKLPIASVTKVMTMLLVMEAIDQGLVSFEDKLTCSAEAAGMGGSQIWLEEGETMTVHDLLKAVAVVSANDACAMLAEHVSGSIEGFVAKMNQRAAELGLQNTKFLDCTGLDDKAYSSAMDVAIISRELLKYEKIKEYTTIWMDTLRNGESELVNTNRLVRFYKGTTGLKTGTTSAAGHCLSATAQREEMELIAVILGCKSSTERFSGARKMLDYGFANYSVYVPQIDVNLLKPVRVLHGVKRQVLPQADIPDNLLLKKGQESQIKSTVTLAESVEAPVVAGQVIGTVKLTLNDQEIASFSIRAVESIDRLTFWTAFERLWKALVG